MLAVNNPYWRYLAVTQGSVVFDILSVDVSGNGIGDSRWPSYFFFPTVENTEKHREKNQGQLGKLACQRQDESP